MNLHCHFAQDKGLRYLFVGAPLSQQLIYILLPRGQCLSES